MIFMPNNIICNNDLFSLGKYFPNLHLPSLASTDGKVMSFWKAGGEHYSSYSKPIYSCHKDFVSRRSIS